MHGFRSLKKKLSRCLKSIIVFLYVQRFGMLYGVLLVIIVHGIFRVEIMVEIDINLFVSVVTSTRWSTFSHWQSPWNTYLDSVQKLLLDIHDLINIFVACDLPCNGQWGNQIKKRMERTKEIKNRRNRLTKRCGKLNKKKSEQTYRGGWKARCRPPRGP